MDPTQGYSSRPLYNLFNGAIIQFMFPSFDRLPQIIFYDSRTVIRNFSHVDPYPLVLPSLQVVTSQVLFLSGSRQSYGLHENQYLPREERWNRFYLPLEHPDGYINACRSSVIFRTPGCSGGDIVGILHVVGPYEYWNMVHGIRESNYPEWKTVPLSYVGSLWQENCLQPITNYGKPNWFPHPWLYLLLMKSYKCQWQRIVIREGDFFAVGPMVWHFLEIRKYHTGLAWTATHNPLAYLQSIYMATSDKKTQNSSMA